MWPWEHSSQDARNSPCWLHAVARASPALSVVKWRQSQANKHKLVTQQETVKHLSERRKVCLTGEVVSPRTCMQRHLDQSRSVQTWGPWPSCGLARWTSHSIRGNWCSGLTQNLYFDQELLGRKWWMTGAPHLLHSRRLCPVQKCVQGKEPFTCQ